MADQPNMQHWLAMARPPVTALKQIKGGRLSGMTDVNPQWRYQVMTEQFGMIGDGWNYTIDKLWTEPGCDGEVLAFAQVSVRVRQPIGPNGSFREIGPVVGIGGNHLIVKESKGLRNNDECWKMATTDALSVALKMLGVAADIYAGRWDGAKYLDAPNTDAEDAYINWLVDLEILAESGIDALIAAIKKSPDDLQSRLRADATAWTALKAKAEGKKPELARA